MTGSVRVLVVLDPSVTGEQVMPSVPVDDVNVVGTIDDPREMLLALRADARRPVAARVRPWLGRDRAADRRRNPAAAGAGPCWCSVHGQPRTASCASVFEAGADDIVALPQDRATASASLIEKALARRRSERSRAAPASPPPP